MMEVLSSRVILHPRDLARSRSFYEDHLGLRLYHEYGRGDGDPGVVYFLGGGFLELSGPGLVAANGFTRLWIQVPSVRAEEARLRRIGVPIVHPARRMPWGLDELVVSDPDGIELVLVEVPPDHFLRRAP